jgi:hypothetical protein
MHETPEQTHAAFLALHVLSELHGRPEDAGYAIAEYFSLRSQDYEPSAALLRAMTYADQQAAEWEKLLSQHEKRNNLVV